MGGIDRLISRALSHKIKKKLDSDELKTIERKLFLEHGMSIKLSIEHFDKFDQVLKNILNINRKKFENDCINEVIKIKKIDDKYSVRIIDQKLIDSLLVLCGDNEARLMLNCLFDNELTIPQILSESKIPKTSGYRKIENLIINGLIVESGKVLSESKRISKYRCVFDELKIEMKKNNIIIQGVINEQIFNKSTCVNT
ncbi:MAG: transcriptional regulator [Nitrosopumilales archaeon CG_4_10_14_0_8_um_filter_34_8]|nr:MAG: transcriptional regulator [Nitrosopumilales archaeon CG_4_10_14_0_8_um_filter_34_8]PJB98160.1 MAG: transcriptional regulator [Nitrosopumilales archaeon CG_4_9_14_0_8_um_filter_34_10]